jgi:hypothetical protein
MTLSGIFGNLRLASLDFGHKLDTRDIESQIIFLTTSEHKFRVERFELVRVLHGSLDVPLY